MTNEVIKVEGKVQKEIIGHLRKSIDSLMGDLERSLRERSWEAYDEGFTSKEMAEMMDYLCDDVVKVRLLDKVLWQVVEGEVELELWSVIQTDMEGEF